MSSPGGPEPHGQMRSEIPAREEAGPPRTVISAGRDVELGARSMLVLADGLFRLDVVPHPDTIQALVRSLAHEPHAELRSDGEVGGGVVSAGDVAPQSSGRFRADIVLIAEDGAEREVARVLVSSVCHLERGLASFAAQAELL